MPVIPRAEPSVDLPEPRVALPDRRDNLERVINVAERISLAYDETEAARIVNEASGNLAGSVRLAAEQYGNPDEFLQRAVGEADSIYQRALDAAPNGRVRAAVTARLADNVASVKQGIAFTGLRKRHDVAEGNYRVGLEQAALAYPQLEEDERAGLLEKVREQSEYMERSGIIKPGEAVKDVAAFELKALGNQAAFEISANPSYFLKRQAQGKYKALGEVRNLELMRSANQSIREGIAAQERELKLEGRKADNVIQQMVDQKAPMIEIEAKLKEYTRLNVIDSAERAKWDNRLKQAEVKDTPQQLQNAQKLMADFKSQYPTYNTVKQTRDLANAMRGDGRLGEAGAGQILGFVNQAQSHLNAEGRANAAAGRAAAGRAGAKVTDAQAKALIAQNYPYDKAGSFSKAHRDDIAAYNEATVGQEDVDKGEIARKIRDDRAKVIREQKSKNALVNQLPPDEAAALKHLQTLPR